MNLDGVRRAGYELGKVRTVTAKQKELISNAVKLSLAERRAA